MSLHAVFTRTHTKSSGTKKTKSTLRNFCEIQFFLCAAECYFVKKTIISVAILTDFTGFLEKLS